MDCSEEKNRSESTDFAPCRFIKVLNNKFKKIFTKFRRSLTGRKMPEWAQALSWWRRVPLTPVFSRFPSNFLIISDRQISVYYMSVTIFCSSKNTEEIWPLLKINVTTIFSPMFIDNFIKTSGCARIKFLQFFLARWHSCQFLLLGVLLRHPSTT